MKSDLKTILKKKGIKQKDIAEAVGRSTSVVSQYLSGQKTMSQGTADKISELIGVPIEDYLNNVKKISKRGHSARVMAYELREGLMGVDSEAHGLHYMLDNKTEKTKRRKLTILTICQGEEGTIKLDLEMAKALIEEIKDICEMQWEGYI